MFFFFNDTATTEIYTLSLHDALPIFEFAAVISRFADQEQHPAPAARSPAQQVDACVRGVVDRKSTRLNSSHQIISYAVFCLKKKKEFNLLGATSKPQPKPRKSG